MTRLPKPRVLTREDQRRSESLKKRYPDPDKETGLTFGRAGMTSAKKRSNSQEGTSADSKKDRVKSPEKVEVDAAKEGEEEAGPETGVDETKQEDVSTKSDDLSSLSVLPIEEIQSEDASGDKEEVFEEAEETLDSATEESASDITVIEKEDNKFEEESLDDTVLLPQDDQEAAGAAGGVKPRVEIVRDYDEVHQSPDKILTPPPDKTGHIAGVQGMTKLGKVNSEVTQEPPLTPGTIMKQNFKSLVEATKDVQPPNTAEKKAGGNEID